MWWQHLFYGLGLLGAIFCMGLIDYKNRYAFFGQRARTIRTLVPVIFVFIIWDIAGIALRIFSDGDGKFRSGLLLGPHFPVEEILFLFLLNYTALIIWLALKKRGQHV